MNGSQFETLLTLVHRKHRFDATNSWAQGSPTYFNALKQEVTEVEEELGMQRRPHLEEELGDVLWNYLNLLLCLDDEHQISADNVIARTIQKFDERVSGIERGEAWVDIKAKQKQRLQMEENT